MSFMFKVRVFRILAIVIGLNLCVLEAGAATDLYRVQTAVDGRSAAAREEGMRKAFLEVLVRASGSADVLASPLVRKAQASRYVESFGFASASTTNRPLLDVVFNPATIEQFVRQAGYPVWGSNRPTVMLWVGVDGQGRQMLSANSGQDRAGFDRAMVKRGIPVLWPTGDVQDDMALPLPKLFGLYRQDIRTASERYTVNNLVAVRVEQSGGRWALDGYLEHQGQSTNLSFRADSLPAIAALLADRIAVYFSERYGVTEHSGAANSEIVTIRGIDSFADFQQVLQVAGKVSGVEQVQVVSIAADVMTLELVLHASWSQVKANLRLDRRLTTTAANQTFIWSGR